VTKKGRYQAELTDPDRSRPDERHAQQLLDDLEEALDSLANGVLLPKDEKGQRQRGEVNAVELVRRARAGTKNGYPASSGLDGVGGGSSVSDPTGELAADLADDKVRDEVDRGTRTLFRELTKAKKALNRAVDALVSATPKAPPPAEPGCRSCAEIGVWTPIYRGDDANDTGRCRWCYDWWLVHGQDPPAELLRIYLEKGRVTTGDIRNWQAAHTNTRHRKHRRSRR
jgi:hypothetical protein